MLTTTSLYTVTVLADAFESSMDLLLVFVDTRLLALLHNEPYTCVVLHLFLMFVLGIFSQKCISEVIEIHQPGLYGDMK